MPAVENVRVMTLEFGETILTLVSPKCCQDQASVSPSGSVPAAVNVTVVPVGNDLGGCGQREGRRLIGGEMAEVHDHIDVFRGVGLDMDGGQVNAGFGVREGAAEGDGGVVFAEGRTGGGVNAVQVTAAGVGPAPAEEDAAVGPGPGRAAVIGLADLSPVSALGVLDDAKRVTVGGLENRLIDGMDAVGSAGR